MKKLLADKKQKALLEEYILVNVKKYGTFDLVNIDIQTLVPGFNDDIISAQLYLSNGTVSPLTKKLILTYNEDKNVFQIGPAIPIGSSDPANNIIDECIYKYFTTERRDITLDKLLDK